MLQGFFILKWKIFVLEFNIKPYMLLPEEQFEPFWES